MQVNIFKVDRTDLSVSKSNELFKKCQLTETDRTNPFTPGNVHLNAHTKKSRIVKAYCEKNRFPLLSQVK